MGTSLGQAKSMGHAKTGHAGVGMVKDPHTMVGGKSV